MIFEIIRLSRNFRKFFIHFDRVFSIFKMKFKMIAVRAYVRHAENL